MSPQRRQANKPMSKSGRRPPTQTISRQDSVDKIREYFGTTLSGKTYKTVGKPNKLRTVIAVGDIHGNPHPALLPHIIAAAPDIIVVGGDALDSAYFSAHPKEYRENRERFDAELQRLIAYFEVLLSETSAEIILVRGNHDNRVWRILSDLIPESLEPFVQIKDPLELLRDALNSDRVHIHLYESLAHHPRLPESEMGKTAYLLPLGDAILSHNNFAGGEPGAAVLKLQKWVDEWYQFLGWPTPTLLIQFHVHQVSYQWKRGGFLCLIEPGMAGMPGIEKYKVGFSAKWKPGSLGGVVFQQQSESSGEWKTMLETVKLLLP